MIRSAFGFIQNTRTGRLVASLTAGYGLSLSQAPTDLGWIATFALVPWFVATRASGPFEAVGLGVATGMIFGAVGSNWIFLAFETQGAVGWYGVLATLATVFWGKGLTFGAVGGVARLLRNAAPVAQLLVVATLFGLGELWMSRSQWGLPVLLVGHSQASVPGIAQLALLGGVPVISGFLIALNYSISLAILAKGASLRNAIALAVAWLTVAALGTPLSVRLRPVSNAEPRTLLLVQPDTPRVQRWEPAFQNVILERIATRTSAALNRTYTLPDAILWPENLLTTPLSRDKRLERQLQAYVDGWGVPLITGLVRSAESSERREYRNSVVWLSPELGVVDSVDKVRAMPLVESSRDFPGRAALAWLLGDSFRGPLVAEAGVARPLKGEFTLSPTLCFEVLFPAIVSDRRDEKSVAIINLADDSWVPGEAADRQLIAAAAFRAVEQRMTLLRISHGGLSVAIDPFGREIASLPPNEYADMTIEVAAEAPITVVERISVAALAVVSGVITWCCLPFCFSISDFGLRRIAPGRGRNQSD